MDRNPLSGTQSIVAVDKRSGEMGAAVLSQSFSAGSKTMWSEPGVGIVVSQATVEPSYGPLGLALMKAGKSSPQTLKSLLATDPRPNVRMVMMVDSRGRTAVHVGKNCLPDAGYLAGRGFCVQANFVNSKRAWKSMAAAFRVTKGGLAERLFSALEAGDKAAKRARRGGAPRSAAILVVETHPAPSPWEGRVLDLRVEDGSSPMRELRTLLKIHEGYKHAVNASELLSRGEFDRGEREFSKATSLAPENAELKLWYALGLINHGEKKRGEAILRSAVGRGLDSKAILRELVARGVIDVVFQPSVRSRGRKEPRSLQRKRVHFI
jgi:uncharacterized Ntn-hydrolase superfamily protein